MEQIKKLTKIINESNNIVFFGGAGVSTESGIKDFRGKDGIYTNAKINDPRLTPEYLLSATCLYHEPEKFFDNFRRNMDFRNAQPNITHKYLKKLEDNGKLSAIVTQNIDGLHQKAGSSNVLEIHGTVEICHCMRCKKKYPGNKLYELVDIPKCECGGILRPNIVLYEERLSEAFGLASEYISKADVLIVGGTSLTVQPASSLINLYRGKHLIIINDSETPYDFMAELIIHDLLGKVFSYLL